MEKFHELVALVGRGADWSRCVLNGVVGDSLEKNRAGLALKMMLHTADGPVTVSRASLRRINDQDTSDTSKICILAHGVCGSEKGWTFHGDEAANYGSFLQRDFGFMPFF